MYNFLANELRKPTEELPHNFKCLLFFESFPFDQLLQIPIFAEFSYDVQTIFRTENIFESHNVRMVESLEQVYFWEDGIL